MRLKLIVILLYCISNVCSKHNKKGRFQLEIKRNDASNTVVYNFGKPTSGREQVYLKHGTIRPDRKTSQATIEHVPCYDVKSIQINLTTTGTPPSAKLDLISRKIVITFTKSFSKPSASAMIYVITARGDRQPGCVEESFKLRLGRRKKKRHEISDSFLALFDA